MLHKATTAITDEFRKIENEFIRIALKDLFGLGCYLHLTGKVLPGLKTCNAALRAIGFNKKHPKETRFIMKNIKNNEKYLLNKIRAHSEINSLFSEY